MAKLKKDGSPKKPNAWVRFLKEQEKKTGREYGDLMRDPQVKAAYQESKKSGDITMSVDTHHKLKDKAPKTPPKSPPPKWGEEDKPHRQRLPQTPHPGTRMSVDKFESIRGQESPKRLKSPPPRSSGGGGGGDVSCPKKKGKKCDCPDTTKQGGASWPKPGQVLEALGKGYVEGLAKSVYGHDLHLKGSWEKEGGARAPVSRRRNKRRSVTVPGRDQLPQYLSQRTVQQDRAVLTSQNQQAADAEAFGADGLAAGPDMSSPTAATDATPATTTGQLPFPRVSDAATTGIVPQPSASAQTTGRLVATSVGQKIKSREAPTTVMGDEAATPTDTLQSQIDATKQDVQQNETTIDAQINAVFGEALGAELTRASQIQQMFSTPTSCVAHAVESIQVTGGGDIYIYSPLHEVLPYVLASKRNEPWLVNRRVTVIEPIQEIGRFINKYTGFDVANDVDAALNMVEGPQTSVFFANYRVYKSGGVRLILQYVLSIVLSAIARKRNDPSASDLHFSFLSPVKLQASFREAIRAAGREGWKSLKNRYLDDADMDMIFTYLENRKKKKKTPPPPPPPPPPP